MKGVSSCSKCCKEKCVPGQKYPGGGWWGGQKAHKDLFIKESHMHFNFIISLQDCRVVIWTKNEVGGGGWTSKVN